MASYSEPSLICVSNITIVGRYLASDSEPSLAFAKNILVLVSFKIIQTLTLTLIYNKK